MPDKGAPGYVHPLLMTGGFTPVKEELVVLKLLDNLHDSF